MPSEGCGGVFQDLQLIEADLQQFGQVLKCNLLAVEYPGYGLCSQAKGCQEVSFEGVADVAMHALPGNSERRLYCCHVLEVDPSQIILHGRSLGSAPVLHLAKRAYDLLHWEIGGIVLQCPFISIRQVAADYVGLAGSLLVPSDCYNNMAALSLLCQVPPGCCFVPILILHGELDKVIKPYHGRALLKKAIDLGHPSIEGIFPANATHNHWSLREDLVKPMNTFLDKHVEGWHEQANWLTGDGWQVLEFVGAPLVFGGRKSVASWLKDMDILRLHLHVYFSQQSLRSRRLSQNLAGGVWAFRRTAAPSTWKEFSETRLQV
eukprot:g21732.t1